MPRLRLQSQVELRLKSYANVLSWSSSARLTAAVTPLNPCPCSLLPALLPLSNYSEFGSASEAREQRRQQQQEEATGNPFRISISTATTRRLHSWRAFVPRNAAVCNRRGSRSWSWSWSTTWLQQFCNYFEEAHANAAGKERRGRQWDGGAAAGIL